MWRYYLVATLLVVAAGSVVVAHRIATVHDLEVRATPRPGQTPTLTRGEPPAGTRSPASFRGEAPWAMSALPDCFDELGSVVGASDFVDAKIPPASQRLPAGTRLTWGGCTIAVGDDDLRIARGPDRLRIPPHAALYRRDDELVLVWRSDRGRTEIRTYGPR